jgi:glucose-1-phosphatase
VNSARPRAVLLDVGKVLVDFDIARLRAFLAGYVSVGPEELLRVFTADGLADDYQCGRIGAAGFHSEVCRRLGREIPRPEFERGWNCLLLEEPLLPAEWVEQVSLRAPVWIVSNTNEVHFDFIRAHYAALRYATGFVLSHEVGCAKPDPRIFEIALESAGTRPQETLFFDDMQENIDAARAMGIEAFLFEGKEQFRSHLEARELM